MPTTPRIAVIGGGPAGLKACESAAKNGAEVTLFDAKPSVGRKFLIAGKSGLNLTNDEDFQPFLSRYTGDNFPVKLWHEILSEFDKEASKEWAQSLGISTFTSSGNKVFPEQMKAAPLLRRWTTSLKSLGVTFHMRHKLSSIRFTEHSVVIAFEDEDTEYEFDHLILALGGASWPSSGSDGKWVEILAELGIGIIPLSSANCGWHIEWNHKFLAEAEGLPLKNILISSLDQSLEGELVITKYGLEGGPIYRLGPSIRKFSSLTLDLKPTFRAEQLIAKMESVKKNIFTEAVRRWKLNPASSALLKHQFNAEALDIQQLAKLVKNLELQATKPRPIEEAISSAGGIAWKEISPDLSLKKHPLLSVAGEMIDWEAPTGGYLIQGCLATGHFAAVNAVRKAMLKG